MEPVSSTVPDLSNIISQKFLQISLLISYFLFLVSECGKFLKSAKLFRSGPNDSR